MKLLKKVMKDMGRLCGPAYLYAIISAVAIGMMLVQNIMHDENEYCIGMVSCNMRMNKYLLFAGKILYSVFWVIILNSLCRSGYEELSWFVVLFPFLAMFLLIALGMLSGVLGTVYYGEQLLQGVVQDVAQRL